MLNTAQVVSRLLTLSRARNDHAHLLRDTAHHVQTVNSQIVALRKENEYLHKQCGYLREQMHKLLRNDRGSARQTPVEACERKM